VGLTQHMDLDVGKGQLGDAPQDGLPLNLIQTLTVAGTNFGTQPIVTVEDSFGNTATGTSYAVTLAIVPNSGTWSGSGSIRINSNSTTGVATFSQLGIGTVGSGYTLTATAPGLADGVSNPFNITPGTAANGDGTLTVLPASVVAGSTGNTLTFTYTAATGGLSSGAIELTVPNGWSAPSTTGSNAGYTTSSTGTVGVAGQVITVSGVTLAGGATATITYGSKASSGPGATATTSAGLGTWATREKSTSGGSAAHFFQVAPPSTLRNSSSPLGR